MTPHEGGEGPNDGVMVRLADGRCWTLPLRDPSRDDPEYDALLSAVYAAEDRPEGLRAELALTIFLLDRAYGLPPDRLDALLSFEPGSPALTALQEAVHGLVIESMGRVRAATRGQAPVRNRVRGSRRLGLKKQEPGGGRG